MCGFKPALVSLAVMCAIALTEGTHTTRQMNACVVGMDYPESCPQPSDPPDRTRCCREGYIPACCQERAITVCGAKYRTTVYSKSGATKYYDRTESRTDPGLEYNTRWCPGPDDSDDESFCMGGTDKNPPSCVTRKTQQLTLGLAIGGVLFIMLITAVIVVVVVRIKIRQ